MRPIILFGLCLLLGAYGNAQAQDEIQGLIEKARKAHGSDAKRDATRIGRIKMEGTLAAPFGEIAVKLDDTFHLTDRFKRVLDQKFNGMEVRTIFVYNGDKGWLRRGDAEAFSIPSKPIEDHPITTFTRLSLAPAQDAKLSRVPDAKVNDKVVAGIQIDVQGKVEELYFDKESGLMLKTRKKVKLPGATEETAAEVFYSDFQDSDGLKLPRKLKAVQGGKVIFDFKVTEIKFLDKLDDSEFAKP